MSLIFPYSKIYSWNLKSNQTSTLHCLPKLKALLNITRISCTTQLSHAFAAVQKYEQRKN